jgi:Glycosyl transferase family 2
MGKPGGGRTNDSTAKQAQTAVRWRGVGTYYFNTLGRVHAVTAISLHARPLAPCALPSDPSSAERGDRADVNGADCADPASSVNNATTLCEPSANSLSIDPRGCDLELTVVMPCLNEAETVATCVRKAVACLIAHGLDGEVIVADNGSTDGSQQLAQAAGARVVNVPEPGYGNALMGGITAARSRYVIMGDADDSYDFTALMPFVERLRAGADLVMGNRFLGGIAPGAMPLLHRYLGNPVLSFIGRLFFGSRIGDFHCGLRGFRRDSVLKLGLQASGMEFATEIVVKATLAGQQVEEVPTTLSPDGRSRPPHLRSWRDGWRHLRFLLLFSPRWLFLIPGIALLMLGLAIGIALEPGPLSVGTAMFQLRMLPVASAMIVIGFQAVLFAMLTNVYASAEGFLPGNARLQRLLGKWGLEKGLLIGFLLAFGSLVGLMSALPFSHGFGLTDLRHHILIRILLPSITALILSCQMIFGTFFLSILGIRHTRTPLAAGPDTGASHLGMGDRAVPSVSETLRLATDRLGAATTVGETLPTVVAFERSTYAVGSCALPAHGY